MTCLDTTFLIDLLRGNERARRKYDELRSDSELRGLSTSIITAYELRKGAKLSRNSNRDLKIVHDLLSELSILELDMATVDLSSEIYLDLNKRGKMIGEFDILIGATCITMGQPLITNDADFDQITKLTKFHY